VVAAASARQFSITTGGMASIFQPDFEGDWQPPYFQYPVAHASPYPLFGAGAYMDVKFTRWVQLEAEGRWQRFNQYGGIYQDNYLIGPRLPVARFWKTTAYAKVLGGFTKMSFGYPPGVYGPYTTIAFGGGLDVKLTKRISLRAVDFEYQYWPEWETSTLSPYGASVGIGYRIF
jgi:hypothetical protein